MTSPSALISRLMRRYPRDFDVLALYEWQRDIAVTQGVTPVTDEAIVTAGERNGKDRTAAARMRRYRKRKRRQHGKNADAR